MFQNPSFSLGLSQNVASPDRLPDDEMGETADLVVGYEIAAPNPARKSKRLKLVPPPLLADYQCESAILNRAREAKMGGTNYYDISVIREKFTKLLHILQRPWY